MKQETNKEIKLEGKFKMVRLFNNTLHLIVYPEDGLRTANELYKLNEFDNLEIIVKKRRCNYAKNNKDRSVD